MHPRCGLTFGDVMKSLTSLRRSFFSLPAVSNLRTILLSTGLSRHSSLPSGPLSPGTPLSRMFTGFIFAPSPAYLPSSHFTSATLGNVHARMCTLAEREIFRGVSRRVLISFRTRSEPAKRFPLKRMRSFEREIPFTKREFSVFAGE